MSEDSHRKLLDDLERISATLVVGEASASPDPADIPVLIDVVSIPILSDAAAEPVTGVSMGQSPVVGRDMLSAELEIESAFIVDDLVDEFLPQLEAILRKRLEERRRQLLSMDAGADADEPGSC